MWYVYDRDTTVIIRSYKTRAAAQAAVTRAHKQYMKTHLYIPGSNAAEDDPLFCWAMADAAYFHDFIEARVTKRNLMSGAEFTQPVNTPRGCDPSTETYWSM